MDRQLEKLLKNIKDNGNFTYSDTSPQRLIINITTLSTDGYVTVTPIQDGYSVQVTDAGNAYLNE